MSDAGDLLAFARILIDRADTATAGLWPRAAALLARQALETAVADLWRARVPPVAACSMRVQLLALRTALADPSASRRARLSYSALSRACHHRAYELAPTADELRAWIDEAGYVIAKCRASRRPVAEPQRADA